MDDRCSLHKEKEEEGSSRKFRWRTNCQCPGHKVVARGIPIRYRKAMPAAAPGRHKSETRRPTSGDSTARDQRASSYLSRHQYYP
mmetsp:Transcript_81885/g.163531  ORF Transcript_81885/g.163531 Transcript_81885/m.163531 type:complete len:85 (+) Transcript_81885:127-381(+)